VLRDGQIRGKNAHTFVKVGADLGLNLDDLPDLGG
jgi:hypothetical protein